jgi:hypothetical protein
VGQRDPGGRQPTVIGYRVGGLPAGQQAHLSSRDPGHSWQVLRIRNGIQSDWKGEYASADDALAALQKEVAAEGIRPPGLGKLERDAMTLSTSRPGSAEIEAVSRLASDSAEWWPFLRDVLKLPFSMLPAVRYAVKAG